MRQWDPWNEPKWKKRRETRKKKSLAAEPAVPEHLVVY